MKRSASEPGLNLLLDVLVCSIALYFYSFVGLKKSGAIENRDSTIIFKIVGKLGTSCEQRQQ